MFEQLDQASLSLSLENLEKDKYLVEKLHSYMVDVAVMFRANPDSAYTELNESLEFQIKLANVSVIIIRYIFSLVNYENAWLHETNLI